MSSSPPPPFSDEYIPEPTHISLNTEPSQRPHTPSPPSYQTGRYGDVWDHWAAADRASQRVVDVQTELNQLERELADLTKECNELKEKSKILFETLHKGRRRSIIPKVFKGTTAGAKIHGKGKEKPSKDVINQEFEVAHSEEVFSMAKLESLQERIGDLKSQLETDMALASEIDRIFGLLGASVAISVPNPPPQVTTAEQEYAGALADLDDAKIAVKDLLRARVTVQNAHRYYTIVLRTIDSVRATASGRAALGALSEIRNNRDYQVAADTASKAQICFNETVRVLTPYEALLPEAILSEFTKLKKMGLEQASRIHGLLYGQAYSSTGNQQAVESAVQDQEVVFACLTHVAVWIQNQVPVAEEKLSEARRCRGQRRRDLVAAWKAQLDPDDP
ncbi:hypothetical protein K439DRAFT_496079 [Ramaria rubella]|nr:hypothetical protein K439DRAFT_496079 [Ramaria rubella]